MNDENDEYEFVNYKFPPDCPCPEEVNGKITCDLTVYDPPPKFPTAIFSHQNLQVLKVFVDEFPRDIPKELGSLLYLENLVLCRCESDVDQKMHRTEIPKTLEKLTKLKNLDLRNNKLCTFPEHLTKLTCLEELHINNCGLKRLPDSLAKLQHLRTLDLSNNSFKDFPPCITKLCNLCMLYLSDGCLESVPEEIKNLVNLERLQLTGNKLASTPKGLFGLVNLKKLYLNNNKLTSLHDEVGNLVNLEYLVLNQNKLTKVPDTIGELKQLRYLNLHENLLFSLPETITNLEQIETLLVDKNPFQVPPLHVCNQGIQSIKNYFEAMKNTKHIHSKRLKVVVLGESMAGKTSLVNALKKGETTEINEADRTFGVMFCHWKPEPDVDELELMVVDCAGQKKYQMTHQLFLSEGALFILAVDLKRYVFDLPESYQDHVGQWISLVAARIPRARILVVPTHIDECPNQEDIDLKCRNIVTNMKEQREEMVLEIDKQIDHVKKTEARCTPSEDLAKIVDHHRERKDDLPVISLHYKGMNENLNDDLAMVVSPVSNTTFDGMTELRKELVRIARNKNLSPNVDINLPESWVKIEQEVKRLRNTLDIPCLSMTELQEALVEHGINVSECELQSCVGYLDAIGELQYFKDIKHLVKNVVINPYWLGKMLKKIFRHDMDDKLTYTDRIRRMGIDQIQFNQEKSELLENGVMTQVLLKCLWSEFLKESDTIFPQLLAMLAHFGLACELRGIGNSLDVSDGVPSPPSYLLPWFFTASRRNSLDHVWPSSIDPDQVAAVFVLPQYLPFGLFARFSVLCHRHDPDDYEHWHKGFYMKFSDVQICSEVQSCKKCESLRVTGRAPKRQLDALWRLLLTLLEEIEKLLKEWPCISVTRYTVCPTCVERGVKEPQHFPCNWFNPHKKTRKAICKKLKPPHDVSLDLLIPSSDVLKGYKQPVRNSDEILDCVLSDDLADAIADKLGTRWPRLARKLNVGEKVRSIKYDDRGDTHEQAVSMLTKWKQKHASDAKITIIIEALKKLNYNDVVEVILDNCRAKENSTNN